jgi:hypothetical protein
LSLVAPFFVKAASASETQLTVFLNGEGGIESVINGTGTPSARATAAQATWSVPRNHHAAGNR